APARPASAAWRASAAVRPAAPSVRASSRGTEARPERKSSKTHISTRDSRSLPWSWNVERELRQEQRGVVLRAAERPVRQRSALTCRGSIGSRSWQAGMVPLAPDTSYLRRGQCGGRRAPAADGRPEAG